jgi:hypothetical protein
MPKTLFFAVLIALAPIGARAFELVCVSNDFEQSWGNLHVTADRFEVGSPAVLDACTGMGLCSTTHGSLSVAASPRLRFVYDHQKFHSEIEIFIKDDATGFSVADMFGTGHFKQTFYCHSFNRTQLLND